MTKKRGATQLEVYEYLKLNPGASMDEIAEALHLPSRSNVQYHLLKLAERGLVDLANGKHRQYRVIEGSK
jgi:predicted transcriptional regulator